MEEGQHSPEARNSPRHEAAAGRHRGASRGRARFPEFRGFAGERDERGESARLPPRLRALLGLRLGRGGLATAPVAARLKFSRVPGPPSRRSTTGSRSRSGGIAKLEALVAVQARQIAKLEAREGGMSDRCAGRPTCTRRNCARATTAAATWRSRRPRRGSARRSRKAARPWTRAPTRCSGRAPKSARSAGRRRRRWRRRRAPTSGRRGRCRRRRGASRRIPRRAALADVWCAASCAAKLADARRRAAPDRRRRRRGAPRER